MRKILPALTLLLCLSAVSCTKSEMKDMVNEENFTEVKQASVASVNGPTTATVNQPISFNVSWPYTGNCEKFKSFKVDTLGDTTHIKLFTSTNTLEDCTGKEVEHSKVFNFKPTKSGTYYLKFFGPDTTAKPIIDTLQVFSPVN